MPLLGDESHNKRRPRRPRRVTPMQQPGHRTRPFHRARPRAPTPVQQTRPQTLHCKAHKHDLEARTRGQQRCGGELQHRACEGDAELPEAEVDGGGELGGEDVAQWPDEEDQGDVQVREGVVG